MILTFPAAAVRRETARGVLFSLGGGLAFWHPRRFVREGQDGSRGAWFGRGWRVRAIAANSKNPAVLRNYDPADAAGIYGVDISYGAGK